jgi:hypothetical protein
MNSTDFINALTERKTPAANTYSPDWKLGADGKPQTGFYSNSHGEWHSYVLSNDGWEELPDDHFLLADHRRNIELALKSIAKD